MFSCLLSFPISTCRRVSPVPAAGARRAIHHFQRCGSDRYFTASASAGSTSITGRRITLIMLRNMSFQFDFQIGPKWQKMARTTVFGKNRLGSKIL
jgi:hypothetical protein